MIRSEKSFSLDSRLFLLIAVLLLMMSAFLSSTPQEPPAPRFLASHGSNVNSIAFSKDGRLLATMDEHSRESSLAGIELWDVASGEHLRNFEIRAGTNSNQFVFSPDGRFIASFDNVESIFIWEVSSGKLSKTLPMNWVSGIAFSPDGRWLAASFIGISIWSTETWELTRTIGPVSGPRKYTGRIAFSPDGKRIASEPGPYVEGKGWRYALGLWDVNSGKSIRGWDDETQAWTFSLSPDGRYIATGNRDGNIILRSIETGEVVRKLTGHLGIVIGLAFSSDGNLLAAYSRRMDSGDEPREFRIWDVASGLNLLTFRGGEGVISTNRDIVAISPDNRWLAVGITRIEAGKQIGTVAMWDLPAAIAAKAAVWGNERPVKAQAEAKIPAVRTEERPAVDQEAATPFETRSFGPGATETLIKTGDASETKLGAVSRTATSFSVSMTTIYEIALYLDEAGARQAFAPFKGQTLDEVLKADDIHRAVIEGEFPKAVVMSFSQNISSNEIRASLNDSFALSAAYDTPEARRFVNYFKGTFSKGVEVVIQFQGDRVLTTVARKPQPEIRSQSFYRALLGLWVGKKKQSGDRGGLLSQIGPLLK